MNGTQKREPNTERPTIADVALKSGLSKATVSKALNLPPERTTLRPETRDRAIRAARDLGYRPNWAAKSLVTRCTKTIGLLYSRPLPPVANVYNEFVLHLMSALKDRGYELLFIQYSEKSEHWRQAIHEQRVDGCLALEFFPEPLAQAVLENNMPAVVVNAQCSLPFPQVLFNDRNGASLLARHLIELGHRRIAYYHGPFVDSHFSTGEREQGVIEAVQAAGPEYRAHSIVDSVEHVADALKTGSEPATALVTFHHLLALELLRALWEREVPVPRRVSIVTFNDVHGTRNSIPPLTTVSLPLKDMAHSAVEMLMRRMDSTDGHEAGKIELPQSLIVRSSAAPPPASA